MQIEAIQEKARSIQASAEATLQNAAQSIEKHQHSEEIEETEKTDKKSDGFNGTCPECQCEKCRARRYQDGSNDSRVSFQMPTKMDPVKAKIKVMAHEMEHVRSEQHKAAQEGKKVVHQAVRIMNDRCEECGRSYVKGGFTQTITQPDLVDFRKMLFGKLDPDNSSKSLIGIA